ncbi:MAG TPA: nucleotidyltransferase family protein [Chthoniobacterales bacterium]
MNAIPRFEVAGEDFYHRILDVLEAADIDFLVGGAFALRAYTGVERDTKDFDLMLRPRDVENALSVCRQAGLRADYTFTHWIAKVHLGEHFIDLIYRAGNGLCEVDDGWFDASRDAEVMGRKLRLCPPEEMVWQKAFIMERERFDGADIQHLLRSCAADMDWPRLIGRFGSHWRVLLSHLILFGFVYPNESDAVPARILRTLLTRLRKEISRSNNTYNKDRVCRGTLLSREQYLPDVEQWGYQDARTDDASQITSQEIVAWTNAIDHRPRK